MAINDGSTGAQLPNLFDGYAVRPSWEVAGVDYHVGITPGTVLKPISSIDMPGVTVDAANGLIRIWGNDVTVDGYDFSGWGLYVQGDNVTIQNCYSNKINGVGIDGRADGVFDGVDYTANNLTIRNCEIDGTGNTFASQWSFINVKGTGTTTVENNYFHDAPTHIFEITGNSTLIYKYNLEEDIGIDPTGEGPTDHVNFTQMLGGQSVNSEIMFNTMIQHKQPAGGQMIQVTGSNATVANNTVIALPGSNGEGAISYMIDPGHAGDYFTGTIRDNFIDASGVQYGVFYPSAKDSNVSVSGNIDLVTGKVINADNTESAVPSGTTTTPTQSAPSTPTIASFSNDSGVAGDHITNDNTLALTGTAAANGTVKVFDGGTQIGTATASSGGTWSYATSALSDGSHNLTATVTNTSGQTSAVSAALAVKIDTVAPSAPVETGDSIVNGNQVNLTGTAEANSAIKIYDGSNLVGSGTAGASGSWTVTTAALTSGSHALTATATDAAGNISALSQPLDPFVGGSGSSAPTTSAWPDATNTGVPDGVTLLPSGGMVINTPGAVISGLNISGTVYINADNVTLMNCRITSGEFYVVKVNAGVTGAVVKDCDIVGSGVAANGNNGIGGQGAFLRNDISKVDNGIVVQGDNTILKDNYIHDLQAGPDAHYDGIQIDGGESAVTISHNTVINDHTQTSAVMIDNYFGPISNINVDNNLLVGGGYTVYSDAQFSGGPITGVSFTNNHMGTGYWGVTDFNQNSPAYTGNVNDGATLAAKLNTATNTGTTSGSTGSTAPAAPVVASFSTDSGVAGDSITSDSTLELKGTAAANSTVAIYDGSTKIGTTTANSTGSWDYITQVLTDAKHMLTATATNASGQTSVASAAVAVTVDTKAPAAPTIASDTVNAANQVVMSGTAEANSAIKVFDGTTQVGTATTNSSGAWSVTTSALSSGSHALTAKATDVAGNVSGASTAVDPVIGTGTSGSTSSTSGSVTSGTDTSSSGTSGTGTSGTGTTAPAAPKIASFSTDSGVAGDHITNDKTLTVAGTAVANSAVKVFDGATQLGTATADASGAWHYSTAALTDGKHSLTATDTVSGVTSKASTALDVTVDTAAPDAPVLLSDPTTHNRATVSGTAEAGSSIKLYEGTTLLGTTTVGSDGDWSVTTPNLKHGFHTFTATATDAAGNTSALSQPIDPPIGSHGANGTSTVEVTNVRQHWDHTATIKGTADPNSEIKLSDGTTSAGSVTAGADGKWSFHTSDLSGKSHAFTAEQVDTTGHVVGTSSGEAIIGSGHRDTLTSTTGNDVMAGKRGADTFEFASNFGQDVIKDFAARGPAHDTIEFSKSVFDSFASVLSHAAQSGHDVVIATGSDTLTLKNTQLDKLKAHDFHFA